jgi:hypothetical protein
VQHNDRGCTRGHIIQFSEHSYNPQSMQGECEEWDQLERDKRIGRLKLISLGMLYGPREHRMTRYELGVEIWRLRKIRKPGREIVEDKRKKVTWCY